MNENYCYCISIEESIKRAFWVHQHYFRRLYYQHNELQDLNQCVLFLAHTFFASIFLFQRLYVLFLLPLIGLLFANLYLTQDQGIGPRHCMSHVYQNYKGDPFFGFQYDKYYHVLILTIEVRYRERVRPNENIFFFPMNTQQTLIVNSSF